MIRFHDSQITPRRAGLEGDFSAPADRVVAHVDLDAFYTSVEQLLDPRLAGKPVVVGGAADQRGVVASASYEARARGVYVPMPLTRAYRVCPEAHFLPGRHDLYGEYSRRVFEIIERFSPVIEKASIDEGYLDWTVAQWRALNPRRDPPTHWPLVIAQQLRQAVLDETGLSLSVGIGANKLVAKIASKQCKPRGLCHVATGCERAFLRPLPLRAVPGIGKRAAEVLAGNGLKRIADAQDLSDRELINRLGQNWADRLRRIANGEGRATLSADRDPKGISNERTFMTDCRDWNVVRSTLYRLVEKAAWRLRRAELVAGTVAIKLRTADFQTRTRARTLGHHTDCHAELYIEASQLLDTLSRDSRAVRLVGVQLTQLHALAGTQRMLIRPTQQDSAERVDQVIDRVRERYGFEKITTAAGLSRATGKASVT